ncbi:MAG: 2,3-bisphosphoglycerate-independent phosphoglycerate mutase [Thermoplasmata archaeon]
MKKIMLIILDGVGDRPAEELNWETPLQAANKENLNFFAKNGITGQMDPIDKGIRAGSDTAHLAILGYDPYKVYPGRGPFEALGLGMELEPGDLAFRANFATVDTNKNVIDRRAGRIDSGTDELARSINIKIEDVEFIVKEGVEHRAALVMRGPGLSANITDADPHDAGLQVKTVTAKSAEAEKTARLLNMYIEKSYQILKEQPVNKRRVQDQKLPANIILPRGPGMVPSLESFEKKYSLKSACVVGIPLIAGICKLAGITPIKAEGATGGLNSNFQSKIETAFNALKDHDFVLVNLKAPDVAGHDGNANKKKEVIEKIDLALAYLRSHINKDTVLAITGDHSTPCSVKDHSGDPVPLLIFGHGIRKDSVKEFDEIAVMTGALNIRGIQLMNILMNLSDRSEKFGA